MLYIIYIYIIFFLSNQYFIIFFKTMYLSDPVMWSQSMCWLIKERGAGCELCSAFSQATKWSASYNQLWPFPFPQRSHGSHLCPIQSEWDCTSEPNCSGRSQTKHFTSQPGWVQSKTTPTQMLLFYCYVSKHNLLPDKHYLRSIICPDWHASIVTFQV